MKLLISVFCLFITFLFCIYLSSLLNKGMENTRLRQWLIFIVLSVMYAVFMEWCIKELELGEYSPSYNISGHSKGMAFLVFKGYSNNGWCFYIALFILKVNNMIKSTFVLLTVILMSYYICSCNVSDASVISLQKTEPIRTEELGSISASNVVQGAFIDAKRYWDSIGLNYVSVNSMESMLSKESSKTYWKEGELIMGEPKDFTGPIPEASAKQIIDNYKKYKASRNGESYLLMDGRYFDAEQMSKLPQIDRDWVVTTGTSSEKIMIIGPIEQFNMQDRVIVSGKLKDAKPDPIVLVRADKMGYVILAQW